MGLTDPHSAGFAVPWVRWLSAPFGTDSSAVNACYKFHLLLLHTHMFTCGKTPGVIYVLHVGACKHWALLRPSREPQCGTIGTEHPFSVARPEDEKEKSCDIWLISLSWSNINLLDL